MSRRSPVQLLIHVVWATRSRRPTIATNEDAKLAAMLRRASADVHCELLAIGNAADHVHVIARISAIISVAEFVRRLKGNSSFYGGWKWQEGYFAESFSIADLEPLARYVHAQRDRHDASHPAEAWITRDAGSNAR